ncbi:hypothetical protein GCM10011394_17840 [Luteimonas terricola]|uniref:HNH nuclease domain-containing protein n=2 Tax=Luteimonas terricola TaxID=645597 RepID=A0ABQ2EHJ1_9GAMM|nr:hypothetical protein GCM10011394_17840 [Luteimonas terricola]
MRMPWTDGDLKQLRTLRSGGASAGECALVLGRTESAIRQRLIKMGLPVGEGIRRGFTADDDETIRINYPMWPAFLVAYLIDRTTESVHRRAWKLGVAKSPDFCKNPMAHLWNGTEHPNSIASRIKPGTPPPNKGLRRPGFAPGRMATTQFKKGRAASAAHNYVPIGTEKFDTKRKVLVRKVTDDPTIFPALRWRPVHVLAWVAAHGPVPEGHIVIFRQGMKTLDPALITVDRLELVTLAENMRRNTIHNYPAPIKRAMQARGVLNRRINKLEKTRSKA